MEIESGDLTAKARANGAWVRGASMAAPGKLFYSVRLGAKPRNPILGFSNGGSVGAFVGSNANAFGIFANGYGGINGVYPQWGPRFASGAIIDLAYDVIAGRFWYRVNGGAWNGQASADPARGTGGHDVSAMSVSSVLPVFGGNNGDECTATFNPPFRHAPPAGFGFFQSIASPAPVPGPDPEPAPPAPAPGRSKIGIGGWETKDFATLAWIERMKFGWYYNWRPDHMQDRSGTTRTVPFVPMIWGENHIKSTPQAGSRELLGFNEPDGPQMSHQSNLTVDRAISLWPTLMAHNLRLGSPGCTQQHTMGSNRWLPTFMARAEQLGYRVDFMAVHYYSTNGRVADFETWLKQVHATYKRPIWITEWCLVDWSRPSLFSAEQNAAFAREALPMLDALPFVERHAWFAANPYDLFGAPTHLFDNNMNLTAVGRVFQDALT